MAYKIGPNCATCHTCKMECPVGAIVFKGYEYYIEPDKCISCGKCAEVCPFGIIKDENAPPPEKHESIHKEADLVVVGGGGSGLLAAVKAAQLTGMKVIVLEAAGKCGGSSTLAHGFGASYTKFHREAGLPDNREQQILASWERSGKTQDLKLTRNATYASCDMMDWLFDLGGWEGYFEVDISDKPRLIGGISAGGLFNRASSIKDENGNPINIFPEGFLEGMPAGMGPGTGPGGPGGPGGGKQVSISYPYRKLENLKCYDHSMGPGWAGTYVIHKMQEVGAKLGVEFLTNHRATALERDENGAICRVIADDPGGQTIIDCHACVIATGCFSRSEKWVKRLAPDALEGMPVHSLSGPFCQGDGMDLVEGCGGKLDLEHTRLAHSGPSHHPFNYAVVRLADGGEQVMVNMQAQRFTNESGPFIMGQDFAKLPEHQAWSILDDNALTILGERIVASDDARDPVVRAAYEGWREQIEEEATFDMAVQKADTIEELAVMCGLDPAELRRTIDRYNELCAKGEDEDFHKLPQQLVPIVKAPFYAIWQIRFNEVTHGGIDNDSDLNCLDAKTGLPIPGLYTCGDCARGTFNDAGEGLKDMSWAMGSGYLVGCTVADYISKFRK